MAQEERLPGTKLIEVLAEASFPPLSPGNCQSHPGALFGKWNIQPYLVPGAERTLGPRDLYHFIVPYSRPRDTCAGLGAPS